MIKLSILAGAVGGRMGGMDREIHALAHPDQAGPDDLALAFEKEALARLPESAARSALLADGVAAPANITATIHVARPRLAMGPLTFAFARRHVPPPGIHPSAVVEPGATLDKHVSIGPLAWVGAGATIGMGSEIGPQASVGHGAVIGAGCLIEAGARICAGAELGDGVVVHANAVIGSDGFSYVTADPGSVEAAKSDGKISGTNADIRKIHSIGKVVIEDGVEIGAGATIDRATIAETRIGRGTKIDNLVMIGHNVTIGANCLIAGQVGISGSAKIGNRVVLAGQCGIADHITIGDDAIVMAAAAVGRDVAARSMVVGLPAMPRDRFFEQLLNLGRLKRVITDVAELKSKRGERA